MNVIFVGTSSVGIPALSTLLSHSQYRFSLVITRPDKPKGRGLKASPSQIKVVAQKNNLKIFQSEDVNSEEGLSVIERESPDIIIVISFGQKLGRRFLALPEFGCINIHTSLLPKYRGAAPIFHAIRNGETKTGVTIFRIVEKMDAGPILGIKELDISPTETAGELEERLSKLSAELLPEVLDNIANGRVKEIPQDESKVTYAPKISKADLVIDWRQNARQIVNLIRALVPAPLAKTAIFVNGKRINLSITNASISQLDTASECGKIVRVDGNGLIVSTKDGCVLLKELQPENKRIMSITDFINGYRPKTGDLFI